MTPTADENMTEAGPFLLPRGRGARVAVIVVLFAAAFAARAYRIGNPPLDFQPTRQYRSAILARAMYYRTLDSAPEWKKRVAESNLARTPQLETPILEYLAVAAYRISGGEHLWMPRLLTSLFWLAGGLFLFLTVRRIAAPDPARAEDAALLSTVFYLFLPFSVAATRTFLRDPLMVTFMLASLYFIVRYAERPSLSLLLWAAVCAAASIFVKPISCPPLFGAFFALALLKRPFFKALFHPHTILFGVIALLPGAAYTFYGMFVSDFLQPAAEKSFIFPLLLKAYFWHMWLGKIGLSVGYPAFVGALLGAVAFRKALPRALAIGLWAGYLVFGLIFNYGVHTHTYYQLMLVPTTAIGLAPLAAAGLGWLQRAGRRPFLRLAAWAALVVLIVIVLEPDLWKRADPAWKQQVALREKIGELVGHSTRTITEDRAYGTQLRYHGWTCGRYWPSLGNFSYYRLLGWKPIPTEERLDQMIAEQSPQYFIVIDMRDYHGQPELVALLNKRYPKLCDTSRYVIFDMTRRLDLDEQPPPQE